MEYKLIDVWLAHGDGGERGIGPIIGVCDTKTNAQTVAKGKAWWGGDGYVNQGKAVKITEENGEEVIFLLDKDHVHPVTLNEDIPARKKEIKEKALEKLTEFEIEVLGIKK